jgi:hypothetical protein
MISAPRFVRWRHNGDYPGDEVGAVEPDPVTGEKWTRLEGKIVRFFRHPDVPGMTRHARCGARWNDHGFIEAGSLIVCPGDTIETDADGTLHVIPRKQPTVQP